MSQADESCAGIPAETSSECVAWFLSGYDDAKAGRSGDSPTTEAQRTGYAAGIAAAS